MPSGKPLSSRSLQTERTLESYLAGNAPPRWMERVMSIDNQVRRLTAELAERYAWAKGEPDFEERWLAIAHKADHGELNELIRKHNLYYPMERDLPMNPRTGEYVLVHGRDFRRAEITPEWILERFPVTAAGR